jgi:hypothetical protein
MSEMGVTDSLSEMGGTDSLSEMGVTDRMSEMGGADSMSEYINLYQYLVDEDGGYCITNIHII